MNKEHILYSFASLFSELVCAGIPLRKSAEVISMLPSAPSRVRSLASEISGLLEEGRSFSDTLAS